MGKKYVKVNNMLVVHCGKKHVKVNNILAVHCVLCKHIYDTLIQPYYRCIFYNKKKVRMTSY